MDSARVCVCVCVHPRSFAMCDMMFEGAKRFSTQPNITVIPIQILNMRFNHVRGDISQWISEWNCVIYQFNLHHLLDVVIGSIALALDASVRRVCVMAVLDGVYRNVLMFWRLALIKHLFGWVLISFGRQLCMWLYFSISIDLYVVHG